MARYAKVMTMLGAVVFLLAIAYFTPAHAGAACTQTYRVKYGDTLSAIATRAQVSIRTLATLNHIRNINYLVAGQVLCLEQVSVPTTMIVETIAAPIVTITPTATTIPAANQPAASTFELIVEYTLDTSDDEAADWTYARDGRLGKQLSYPISSGDFITSFATLEEVVEHSAALQLPPLFWLARSSNQEPFTYTLVIIDNPQPLIDLQLDSSNPVTDMVARTPGTPIHVLGSELTLTATLHAEWKSVDGLFLPFQINAIDYQTNIITAQQKYSSPAFALHPANLAQQDLYSLVLVLNEEGAGPPGAGWRQRCTSWRSGGWWFHFLRTAYRC